MRLHIDEPNPLLHRAKVYFNGHEIRDAVEADEERGFIRRYLKSCGVPIRDKNGNAKISGKIFGTVKIVDPLAVGTDNSPSKSGG